MEESVIASGTVFNQILLWHLEGNKPFSPVSSPSLSSSLARRVKVRLILSGHEVTKFPFRYSLSSSYFIPLVAGSYLFDQIQYR